MSKSDNAKRAKIVGIIPARAGSKGVPKKNIKPLGGHPLIAYSIAASKLSTMIERTMVSTDSQEIARTAFSYGAEVPFLRPKEFARDTSPDIEFIRHLLGWFKDNEGFYPEYLVHLRPTTPLREPFLIDKAVGKMIRYGNKATALRSVHATKESPYKLFGVKDEFLEGLFPGDPRPEYYNLPRQEFSDVYYPNGYVDIIKSKIPLDSESLHGPKILSFLTPVTGELDRLEDFEYIEFILKKVKNTIHKFLKDNFKPEVAGYE